MDALTSVERTVSKRWTDRTGVPAVPFPRRPPAVEMFAALRDGLPHSEKGLATALDALEQLSAVYFRDTAKAAKSAEAMARAMGRPDLEIRARILLADAILRGGDSPEAGRMAQALVVRAVELGDGYVIARSHFLMANFFRHIGDLSDALAHAVQAVSNLDEDAPAWTRARHLCTLAVSLGENGSHDEELRRYQESLELASSIGDAELSMMVLNNMAYTAYENGDEQAARRLADQMREVEAHGGVQPRAHFLDTIARIEMMSGRYVEAENTLRPVLDAAGERLLAEGDSLAECLITLAEAQRCRGALASCQQTLDDAAAVCEERGMVSYRARVREQQAQLYAASGRYREAYLEHRDFHEAWQALQSTAREARARAMQAAFEIEEARRTSELFREMAQRDPLTGLHNRRFVNERLPKLLVQSAERCSPISAALLDLDHFKRINDTLSHEVGDLVLKRVAALITAAAPEPFIAARMGGEEFLIVLPDVDGDEAMARCERLRRAIREEPWSPTTGQVPVTTSIGLTTVRDGQITPSALLSQADRNLYAAKRSGRDRVVGDPG